MIKYLIEAYISLIHPFSFPLKLKRFKNGVQDLINENQETADKVMSTLKELDDKYDIVDKLAAAPKNIEAKIRSTYKYW